MIHYNQKYFETEGVTILEFGKGTISVCPSASEKDKEVYILFRTTEAGKIGDDNGLFLKGMTANDVKPEVMFAFPKVESIDVVIDALIEAKNDLAKMQEGKSLNDHPNAVGEGSVGQKINTNDTAVEES